jgi:hypothetical protein
VVDAFDLIDGPVVACSDVASATGCSQDSARRKLDAIDPDPINPDDPIFADRPSFASGNEALSERVDELLSGWHSES